MTSNTTTLRKRLLPRYYSESTALQVIADELLPAMRTPGTLLYTQDNLPLIFIPEHAVLAGQPHDRLSVEPTLDGWFAIVVEHLLPDPTEIAYRESDNYPGWIALCMKSETPPTRLVDYSSRILSYTVNPS